MKTLKGIVYSLLGFVVPYLLGSFIFGSFDSSEWDIGLRATVALFGGITSSLIFLANFFNFEH